MSWEAGVMMMGVGILWYLAILLINTDKEHFAIKLFYLLISMWFMVALVNLGLQIAIENSATSTVEHSISILYSIVVWIARIVTTYFVFYYFYNLVMYLKKRVDDWRAGKSG